jgi:hypothetical protein
MFDIKFQYKANRFTWATVEIVLNSTTVFYNSTYLRNFLGGLANTALELIAGKESTFAYGESEPGTIEIIIRKIYDEYNPMISVLIISDCEIKKENQEGASHIDLYEMLETSDYIKGITKCLLNIYNSIDIDEFNNQVGKVSGNFPFDEMKLLENYCIDNKLF